MDCKHLEMVPVRVVAGIPVERRYQCNLYGWDDLGVRFMEKRCHGGRCMGYAKPEEKEKEG